jgi:hypothetical protein
LFEQEDEMSDENETMGDWETMRGDAWTLGDATTLGSGDGRVMLAGRYRVVKRLGEGGMGSVWLAEDTKLDGRKVAVKMLPSVLAGKKGAYKQVKAEAMMAMKLSHPNIATVRAFEEDEGGSPFLVMDYIEGEGLDDILAERGPLSEEETVCLLGPVAAALDYAHSQGVVHRDVKPGNVMVRKDGTPFVLDFGIAREIQETLTRVTGKMSSGTLLYMSPEQLHGSAPKAAQDVYSFAAMAYECLAGTPPFSRGQIEYQIDHDTPKALSESVGAALREGVIAGLAKEAARRPATCAGVLGGATVKNGENCFAGNENRRAENKKAEGPRQDGRGDEDVFLLEVRAGKALKMEGKKAKTPEERAQLDQAKVLYSAGMRAFKAGRDGVAAGHYAEAERRLMALHETVASRREQEREAREVRREQAREAREVRREQAREARIAYAASHRNYGLSLGLKAGALFWVASLICIVSGGFADERCDDGLLWTLPMAVVFTCLLMMTLPIRRHMWQIPWLGLLGAASVGGVVSAIILDIVIPFEIDATYRAFAEMGMLVLQNGLAVGCLAFWGFHAGGKNVGKRATAWILAGVALLLGGGFVCVVPKMRVWAVDKFKLAMVAMFLAETVAWAVVATCERMGEERRSEEAKKARRIAETILGVIVAAGVIAWSWIVWTKIWEK